MYRLCAFCWTIRSTRVTTKWPLFFRTIWEFVCFFQNPFPSHNSDVSVTWTQSAPARSVVGGNDWRESPLFFWPQLFEGWITPSSSRINNNLMDKCEQNKQRYPLDSDLSRGQLYLTNNPGKKIPSFYRQFGGRKSDEQMAKFCVFVKLDDPLVMQVKSFKTIEMKNARKCRRTQGHLYSGRLDLGLRLVNTKGNITRLWLKSWSKCLKIIIQKYIIANI